MGWDYPQEHFLALVSNDHIRSVRVAVLVELQILLILLQQVVLKDRLVVNARHRQTSGNTLKNSLLEGVKICA